MPTPIPLGSKTSIEIGQQIDHQYEVKGVLGSGAMGTVYRVRDEKLERDVALKLVHAEQTGGDDFRKAFMSEARAMAKVSHPNVVTIHALGEDAGCPYFVMEWVRGSNLSVWHRANRRPSLSQALAVLDPLCAGVDAIHRSGAVHRDLKPGNVLIDPGGRVAVTDFGLAQPIRLAGLPHDDGQLWGTPTYLAPELGRDEEVPQSLVKQSDVYSLGVIAFELLTGRLPFRAPTLFGMLEQHAHHAPPRATATRPDLPALIDDVLAVALEKDPARRHDGAESLRLALGNALGGAGVATRKSLRTILVVDDDAGSLLTLRELLLDEFVGVEVITVTDPTTAARLAKERPLDLVISDLEMPHGGGAALTAALRGDAATRTLPIIVITGHGGASDWRRLRTLGADLCLLKPLDVDTLMAGIRAVTGENLPTR